VDTAERALPAITRSNGPGGQDGPPDQHPRMPKVVNSERVVFAEEGQPNQYLKLIVSGDLDDVLLERPEFLSNASASGELRLNQALIARN
jgi:hypothetical protein